MKLTPEDQSKLRDKELANIIRKLNSGKTLTAREEAKLAAATVAGDVQTSGIRAPATGFAKTWDELGKALGVSRRAIQDWRGDPRYTGKCPVDRADGRKDVAAWLRFMIEHGLARADEKHPSEEDEQTDPGDGADVLQAPRVGGTAVDWKKANLALDHRKKETELSILEGSLLVAADLEAPLGALLAAIQTKLSQYPDRVARFVVGLRDVQEVADKLRDEMDADLGDLHAARYLEATLVAQIEALPFDEETARLYQLITFDGQDRTTLNQLIALVARSVLAQIGRKTLANIRKRESITDEDLADSATGQVTADAAAAEAEHRASATSTTHTEGSPERPTEAADKTASGPSPSVHAPASKRAGRAKKSPAKPATAQRDVEPVSAPRPSRAAAARSRRSRR